MPFLKKNSKTGSSVQAARRHRVKRPKFAAFLALTISGLVCSLVVLAGWTNVPQITRAPGTIMPFGEYLKIETMHGGIVSEVYVHNGQIVEAGDVLVQLDHPDLTQERDVSAAQLSAVEQELLNANTILSVLNGSENLKEADFAALEQEGMFMASAKLRLYSESQKIHKVSVQRQGEMLEILKAAAVSAQQRLAKKEEGLARYAKLKAQGLKSLSDFLEEEDEVGVVRAVASDAQVRLAEAHSARVLAEASMKQETLALHDEMLSRISELERERRQLEISLEIVNAKLDDTRIVAPTRGIVQAVVYPNPGEVIAPGETLFELLPTRNELVVEARIPNSDVGHVKNNQPVSISVDTYDARRFGKAEGRLKSVYPVPLTDEKTGETYFRASIVLDNSKVGTGGLARPLQAGMTVVAEMTTGEQTMLAYLLKPVQLTMDRAFNER